MIEERVAWAAKMLDLTPYLDRRPKQLSGGQRQRVAMGRAIVREPKVFLMDEPLSNLDAKLRVQMRGEIARLQYEIGTTTIYVTHDQVEAMTMGHRVAVMNAGVLQQIDTPQQLYDAPANVFVAGLHRHAADEPVRRRALRRRRRRVERRSRRPAAPPRRRDLEAIRSARLRRRQRRRWAVRSEDLHPAREPSRPAVAERAAARRSRRSARRRSPTSASTRSRSASDDDGEEALEPRGEAESIVGRAAEPRRVLPAARDAAARRASPGRARHQPPALLRRRHWCAPLVRRRQPRRRFGRVAIRRALAAAREDARSRLAGLSVARPSRAPKPPPPPGAALAALSQPPRGRVRLAAHLLRHARPVRERRPGQRPWRPHRSRVATGFDPADTGWFHGGDLKGLTGGCTDPSTASRGSRTSASARSG